MYEVVDITEWRYENKEVSGSKEKRWYRDPVTNELVLFKLPISYSNDNWRLSDEVSGETWAEKIASELGAILNIPVHKVEIGCLQLNQESIEYYGIDLNKVPNSNMIYGALCYSFLKEGQESLIEGADMIMDFDESYDRKELRGTKEIYNYDLLDRLFYKHNISDELLRMVVFDTLIGNTDRHQDNFGLIRDESTGQQRFAPLYDNSSSLGRELPIRNVGLMLRDPQMFDAYLFGNKSTSLIRWDSEWTKKRLNIFGLFDNIVQHNPAVLEILQVIRQLEDRKIQQLVSKIPDIVMSTHHKEFVGVLLKRRRDYLEMRYLNELH